MTKFSRAASFHEAGHAVATVFLGAAACDIQVFENGVGVNWSRWDRWRGAISLELALLGLLLVFTAGVHAEARGSKRAFKKVRAATGINDFMHADGILQFMIERGFIASKKVGWRRVDAHRALMMRLCWPAIEAVAARLESRGFVRADELKRICKRRKIGR